MKNKKLLYLVFVIIAAIALFYAVNRVQTVLGTAKSVIADELTRSFHTNIEIHDLKLNSVNSILLTGIVVYDKHGNRLLAVPKIEASFDVIKLITEQADVSALTEVNLYSPDINVRRINGQWNYEDVITKETKDGAKFGGKVSLINATAEVSLPEGTYAFDKVAGSLSFVQAPTLYFELEGVHNNSPFKVSGSTGPDNRLNAKLELENAKLDQYIKDVNGIAQNINFEISTDKDKTYYCGEAYFSDVTTVYNGYKVTKGTGKVIFNQNEVALSQSQLQLNGETVALSGTVMTNGSEPVLNIHVKAEDANINNIFQNMAYVETIDIDASITGRLSNLTAAGKFKAKTLDGTISGEGQYEIASEKYYAKLSGKNLDVAKAGIAADFNGRADIEAVLDGQADFNNARIYGEVIIPQGAIHSIPMYNIYSAFDKQGSAIKIEYFTADIGNGIVIMDGSITGSQLQLKAKGQNIDLAVLGPVIGGIDASGYTNFNADITGRLAQPQVHLEFNAGKGQLFKQPFNIAGGQLILVGDKLQLENVALYDGPTYHKINGTINLKQNTVDGITIATHKARAENLRKLLFPDENITGNVDNDMNISGPINNLNIYGNIRLTEGSFRGQLVEKAEGSYRRETGLITIEKMKISSLNTQIDISGTINSDRTMNFDVVADAIDIERLHVHLPYHASGIAGFSGRLTGTTDKPNFSGALHSKMLTFNNQEIKDISGLINIIGEQIDISNFSFRQNGGNYSFSGGYNSENNDIYGGLEVEKADINALLAIFNMPQKNISGYLNGHIIIGGKADDPDVWVSGQLEKGKIKDYLLEDIDIDLALNNHILTINQFTARQGQGVFAAKGSADLKGSFNIEIGGQNIDAGIIAALFDTSIAATGKLNFAAQVGGTAHDPKAAVSLEVKEGGLDSSTFDVLYGLFIIDKQNINVNQLYISKGPYRASAYGLIPLKALDAKKINEASINDQMDLKFKLDHANLSILPLLTKEVSWAQGQTSGEVVVAGTLAQPRVYGRIAVNDGVVKLAALDAPIQKVGVDIEFQGDKINVQTFEGVMGQGYYTLNGIASLKGWSLTDYNFSLAMNNLGIQSKYFTGPLNGKLNLASGTKRPQLTGNILLERDTINIPVFPETENQLFDLGLDVTVQVGKRVRLYNPYLYDAMVEGQINIAGSSNEPALTGHVKAIRGTVSYLRTPFKIKEAAASFNRLGSFEPLINLSAQARLESTIINMNITGPITQMELKLSSEPNMGQREIMTLLTLRGRTADNNGENTPSFGREEMLSLLDAGLQMRFVSELENTLRNVLGLDDFRFTSTTINAGENTGKVSGENGKTPVERDMIRERQVYNVQIGKYISDRLMLNYTTAIDEEAYTFGFQYDLTRQISLAGSINEKNKKRFGLEMRFSF